MGAEYVIEVCEESGVYGYVYRPKAVADYIQPALSTTKVFAMKFPTRDQAQSLISTFVPTVRNWCRVVEK